MKFVRSGHQFGYVGSSEVLLFGTSDGAHHSWRPDSTLGPIEDRSQPLREYGPVAPFARSARNDLSRGTMVPLDTAEILSVSALKTL